MRKRSSQVDKLLGLVTQICASHKVPAQEVSDLGLCRFLRSRCVGVDCRHNKSLAAFDVAVDSEVGRPDGS